MKKFFSAAEIAERYNVKVTTVWEWLRSGRLTAIRIGRGYRVSNEDLEKFEKEGRVKA